MRTLANMKTQVARLVNDTPGDVFDDAALGRALADALTTAARQMVNNPVGKKYLRQYTSATVLQSGVEEYSRPDDQLGVERVEFREEGTERWRTADYRPPQPGRTPPPLYWFDDVDDTKIRIWPAFDTVGTEEYRLRYYAVPLFPQDSSGTFNDPYGDGSEIHGYPEQLDLVCEYGAALNLLAEENLNTTPLEHLQQEYQRTITTLVGGISNVPRDRQNTRNYATEEDE